VSWNFIFCAEIILFNDRVASKILLCVAVTDQNWLTSTDGLSLSLVAVVGVETVNDPNGVERVTCVQGSFLVAALWWHNVHALGGGADSECLLVQPGIGLNLDLLTETDNWISTENIGVFIADNLENVSCNGTLASFAGVEAVGLFNVDLLDTEVSGEMSINLLVAEEDGVTGVEETISREGPWDDLVAMLHFAESVIERQSLASTSHLVIVRPI
jgi:hypothetical protein